MLAPFLIASAMTQAWLAAYAAGAAAFFDALRAPSRQSAVIVRLYPGQGEGGAHAKSYRA